MEEPTFYEQFDKNLYKIVDASKISTVEIDPANIMSGPLLSTFIQNAGVISSGKIEFTNTDAGYILGLDDGVAKLYIGDSTSYLNFDGTDLTVSGNITASTITGGTFQTASSGTRIVISDANDSIRFFEAAESSPRLIFGLNDTYAAHLYMTIPAGSGDGGIYILNAGNSAAFEVNSSNATCIYTTMSAAGNVFVCQSIVNSGSNTVGLYMNLVNSGAGAEYAFSFDGDEKVNAAVGGSQDYKIRVKVDSTDYYIPLYTT